MDNALRRLALLFALALPCHAQGILAPILFGTSAPPVTGTNIVRVTGNGKLCGGGTGSTCAVSYQCSSTSNRLAGFFLSQGTSLTITDTQGEAAGAYYFGGTQTDGSQTFGAFNMACAASSNTITETAGSGGVPAAVIAVWEYSGTGTSGDGFTSFKPSTGTTCSVSETASHTGDLEIVVQQFGNQWTQSTNTTPLLWLTSAGTVLPGSGNNANFTWTDNLYAPLGSVSYTGNFASATSPSCYMILIPGTAATSPGFYPQTIQTDGGCTSTSTNPTFSSHRNVQSGSVMTFDFGYNGNTIPIAVVGGTCGAYSLQVTKASGTSNEELIYTCKTASSGAETVTVTGSFGNYPCGTVTEHSGLASATATDTGGNTTGAATMTWSQPVTNNLSFVHAACSSTGAGATSISGTGYYPISVAGPLLSAAMGEEAVVPTSGPSTPSLTFSGSNTHTVCASITLQ